MEMKFYKCSLCGRIVEIVKDSASQLVCCGEAMDLLVPGKSDGAVEKHVPVVEVNGTTVTVKVGEVAHPMLEEHYIEWIAISTSEGTQRKALKPGDAPVATFALTDTEQFVSAMAYCNLHSLWSSK